MRALNGAGGTLAFASVEKSAPNRRMLAFGQEIPLDLLQTQPNIFCVISPTRSLWRQLFYSSTTFDSMKRISMDDSLEGLALVLDISPVLNSSKSCDSAVTSRVLGCLSV